MTIFHQIVSANIYPQSFKVTPISRNCKRINAISCEQKKLREWIVKLRSPFLHKTPRPEKNHMSKRILCLCFFQGLSLYCDLLLTSSRLTLDNLSIDTHVQITLDMHIHYIVAHCTGLQSTYMNYGDVMSLPECIYYPITAMGFSAMFTFQLDNTKR